MSRTRRIYNSKHWKWHSEHEIEFFNRDYEWIYTGTDFVFSGVVARVVKEKYNPDTWEWRYRYNTFRYHPYKQLCMGCCSYCRRGKDRKLRHRRRMLRKIERNYRSGLY